MRRTAYIVILSFSKDPELVEGCGSPFDDALHRNAGSGWFDKLTMTPNVVILSLSKDPELSEGCGSPSTTRCIATPAQGGSVRSP